jgi:tRNA-modifying protein YgfZ
MLELSSRNEAPSDYTAACTGAAVFDLSARGKIELAGPDARLFLHNLCTNDTKDMPAGGSCEAFLCTAKARVIAHIFVMRRAGEQHALLIDFEPGMTDKVFNHLNHYLISERVELSDRTAELSLLRVAGPKAKELVESLKREVRPVPCLSMPAYDVLGTVGEAAIWRGALAARGAVAGSPEVHEILRIEAGWPVYGVDIDDNRFVVEVGRTQAISYAKGCFLGQEPIVMARDRGHVNRLLSGVKGDGLVAGLRLFKDGNEVGQATSVVRSPRLGSIGLAYLKRGNWEPDTVLTTAADVAGRPVTVAVLPFISSV